MIENRKMGRKKNFNDLFIQARLTRAVQIVRRNKIFSETTIANRQEKRVILALVGKERGCGNVRYKT